MFGIAIARAVADAQITAVDWHAVLSVARENADAAGVSGRYHTLGGVRSTLIGAAGSIWCCWPTSSTNSIMMAV